MFFYVSKIFWLMAQPLSLAIILLALGFLLSFLRGRWLARAATLLSLLILVLSAFTTLGYVMVRPLEGAFERPASLPSSVAGIIVLGGGMDVEINAVRHGYELNRAGDRFVEALRLAELYPEARIVISGGMSDIAQEGEAEATGGARFFVDLGIDPARIVTEAHSRNTDENALMTRALLEPRPGEAFVLVTSAFHMPRAVGLFRKAGFDVIPWPVDYRGTGLEGFALTTHQPAENLTVTTLAVREWLGLMAYHLTGRIDDLLPAPQ